MQTSTPATLFKNSLIPSSGVQSLIPFSKPTTPTNNVGATATTPTPQPTVSSSPAKSAYISSIAPTVSSVQPTQTTSTASQSQPITGNATTPSGVVVNATTGATVSTPAPDKNAAYTDAYNRYIQSLTPSTEETNATKNLNNLTLQSQKDQTDALYRNGGTTTSAGEEANKINRDESFGIDAASNTLNALTGQRTATTNAAKARADFEKGLLDSSAASDKTAFDEKLATTKQTQDQANADRTFEENKREYGLDYAQKAQQIAIDQQKANQTGTGLSSSVSNALLSSINDGTIDPNKINSRTVGIYNAIAQAGVDAVGSHAGAAGETKAVTDLAAYKSTATRTLGVIDKNLPLVSALADKVNQTGVPGLDQYIQGVKSYTGNDTNVIKYVNSIKTLRSEYAQMLSKGSAPTEGDKAEAAQAIPAGLSSAGYNALGDQLKLEANNIISASDGAIAAAKNKSASNNGPRLSNLGGTPVTAPDGTQIIITD